MTNTKMEIKNAETVRALAPECTVLLKKDGKFPLQHPQEIALYGSGARQTIKGGTGSGCVNSRHVVSIEEGLENAGFCITTKNWLDSYDKVREDARKKFVADIHTKAKEKGVPALLLGLGAVMPEPEYSLPLEGKGRTAVYVLARISGEGCDRNAVKGDLLLSDTEIRDILEANSKYENFMLVLNVGGVVDLSPVSEVKNILYLSQLGAVVGDVFADLILGKAYPSGKLTTTWAKLKDYPTIENFGDENDTYYKEGIYIGYKYFDKVNLTPLFPFGFGLSYTNFKVTPIDITNKKDTVTVYYNVTNTGKFIGKEVVKLYLSAPSIKIDQPKKVLVAFSKTKELKPNETQRISLSFKLSDFAYFEKNTACYMLESGNYGLLDDNDRFIAKIELCCDVRIKQCKNLCGNPDFKDLSLTCAPIDFPDGLKSIQLTKNDFEFKTVNYTLKHNISEKISPLSLSQKINLCLGHFNSSEKQSVIGNSAVSVVGAAGETSHVIEGFPVAVMADGPAGLRLDTRYGLDEKGAYKLQLEFSQDFLDFLDDNLRAVLMSKKTSDRNGHVVERYCTAIPIATAIAQSWNLDLAFTCGDVVGKEMQAYGIHIWLAPAFNIHRSPLCGRNYEYCSEDPVVSGAVSAAIVRGVQSHKGCGATIKHFACNNQETNRYASNSHVSERALRELYLKGFEIAVRDSNPFSVMTSYNLLNGIHTSENKDLLQGILRCEFEFDGLIMSDWVTQNIPSKSKYPYAYASKSVAAGNDLFMPGTTFDYNDMVKAIENGELTEEQVGVCATNVYNSVKKLF